MGRVLMGASIVKRISIDLLELELVNVMMGILKIMNSNAYVALFSVKPVQDQESNSV
jgi:hypothetical protein